MRLAGYSNQLQYRQWRGPSTADATKIPFVMSELVPQGQIWKIMFASAEGQLVSNQLLRMHAVPPPASYSADYTLFQTAGGISGLPPLVSGVQLSKGAPTTALGVNEMKVDSGSRNSVNLLTPWTVGFKLLPNWRLVVSQNPNGGGGSGFFIVLSFAFLPFAIN